MLLAMFIIVSTHFLSEKPIYISMEKKNLLDNYKSRDRKILLFDIDGTLYKISKDLEEADRNGYKKAFESLSTTNRDINDFFKGRSTFLQAMYDELNVTPGQFDKAKGEIKYENYMEKNERLVSCLSNTIFRLWCFTNGLRCRAEAILKKLGIEELFEGVICTDYDARRPVKKPYTEAYVFVEELLGVSDGSLIYFFDDLERNIKPALERGWNAFLVGADDDIVNFIQDKIKGIK